MDAKVGIKKDLFERHSERRNEIVAIIFFTLAVFIFLSLITFDYNDLSVFSSQPNDPIKNRAGMIGAYLGCILSLVMGVSAYAIPLLLVFWAFAWFAGSKPENFYYKFFGTVFLIMATSSTFTLLAGDNLGLRFRMGGIVGVSFADFLVKYFNVTGAAIAIFVLLVLSLLVATDFLIIPFIVGILRSVAHQIKRLLLYIASPKPRKIKTNIASTKPKIRTMRPSVAVVGKSKDQEKIDEITNKIKGIKIIPKKAPVAEDIKKGSGKRVIIPDAMEIPEKPYVLPGLSLLFSPPSTLHDKGIKEDLTENSRILEEILKDFDIEAKVIEVSRGPMITRYELEPGAGIRVPRITSLSDNIALGMKASSVRIIAPVPGKGTIGVEVPNAKGVFVYMKEVLESEEYADETSKLKMALGKNISGEPVVADLGEMPHLLIAGATGSGKTVCVNSIIISLLFNATPDELKFIMVDPKKVELAAFNDLPHLLCPVITEHKKVSAALNWLVEEMDKRFRVFAARGVRNIESYNKKAKEEGWEHFYYIVAIIDELADLMMVAQQEIEGTITRLAAMSRAVGIHMILATQRPSVNVITGVIKANFPSRISFKVASKVDSRTVLDRNGADKLLGRGDMLFLEPANDKPVRAQGSLVSDEEIVKVTSFIKAQREPEYQDEMMNTSKKSGGKNKFKKDEVYEEALRIVLMSKQASVSMLQRKLGVGYTRAARLIDMMEDEGIIGPYQGSKSREVLVDGTDEGTGTVDN